MFLKFLGSLLVGFLTSILVMWPMMGLTQAFQIIALSIICTAGIGLIIWIPVWALIGWITLKLITMVSGKSEKSGTPPPLPNFSREEKAIINYLEIARRFGTSDEKATADLKTAGWSDDAIDNARRKIKQDLKSPTPPR